MGQFSKEKELFLNATHETGLPIIVGGAIGSGKSTIAKYLESKGRIVYDPEPLAPFGLEITNLSNYVIVSNGDNVLETFIKDIAEHVKIKCFKAGERKFFTQYVLVKADASKRIKSLSEDRPIVLIQGFGAKNTTDVFIERNPHITTVQINTPSELETMIVMLEGRMGQEALLGPQNDKPYHFHVKYELFENLPDMTFKNLTKYKINIYITVHTEEVVTSERDASMFLHNVCTIEEEAVPQRRSLKQDGVKLYLGRQALKDSGYGMNVKSVDEAEMMFNTLERRKLNGAEGHIRYLIDIEIADKFVGDLSMYNDKELLAEMKVSLDIVATIGSSRNHKHVMTLVNYNNIIWEV